MQNEIRVWKVVFPDFYPHLNKLLPILSSEERQKAKAFIKLPSQHNFIITRAALHTLFCKLLKNKEILLKYNKYGKPSIDATPIPLHFNISHAENLALFAFADYEIGIDVEFMRDELNHLELAKRFFSKDEYLAITSHPPHVQQKIFFNIWSKKEAIIKAIGYGLSHPLSSFTVDWQQERQVVVTNGRDYFLQTLPIDVGYTAAVANSSHAANIVINELNLADMMAVL
jgi:4'-phosphopantetheinyl transferase